MDGIVLINKPKGITSRDVVNQICSILDMKKVGHTGTLDPNAIGVLVVCVGNATKIVDLLTNQNKTYLAEITLGIATTTLDPEGEIIKEEKNLNITKKDIERVLPGFTGNIIQEVPIYSAVKVNGKKLYEYARNNEPVELPKRNVTIHNIELIDDIKLVDGKIIFQIKCDVSKGTYIRSLVNDIAKELGTCGMMSNLVRLKQGNFLVEDCQSLDDIINNGVKLISIADSLTHINKIEIDEELYQKVRNGAVLDKFFSSDIILLTYNNKACAIYKEYDKDKTKVKPMMVFND